MIKPNYLERNVQNRIDFDTDLYQYIYKDIKYVKDINKYNKYLDKLLQQAISNGLFMRNTANKSSFNYWQPLSNAGLPSVPRADYIHELTFFIHDVLHNLIPDVQISGNTTLDKKVYIIERMLGEGICLVLADMYFCDALKNIVPEYDYDKKNIYQGFRAIKNNSIYDNLLGNVMFCITGKKDHFKIDKKYEKDLDKYLEWFSPVYISDLKWTLSNVNSKLCKYQASINWLNDYKNIIPGFNNNDDINVLTTSYLIEKLNIKELDSLEEMILKIFNYIYYNIFEYNNELKKYDAKKRFYCFQAKIAYDYSLDKEQYKQFILNEQYQEFDALYQKDILKLYEDRIITEKEYNIFKEIYPHHTACFISYTAKYVENMPLKTYSKKLIFEVL